MRPHILFPRLTEAHVAAMALATDADVRWLWPLIDHEFAFAAMLGNRVIGAGGFIRPWPSRAVAWAFPFRTPRAAWPAITTKVEQMLVRLQNAGVVRIEAQAVVDNDPAHRWLHRLGFTFEAQLSRFNPDGTTADQFVLLRRQVIQELAA